MAFSAVVLNVMFACPSDVVQERQALRDVIDGWNSLHAERERCVLAAVDWLSHSVPAMGERPQSIINRQVLANADLLVAAFWTRIGSPTGAAESGTIEEIDKHIDSGKPALIYFSSSPTDPNNVDPQQLAALRDFKARYQNLGLTFDYSSEAEFKEQLNRHLVRTVRALLSTSDAISALQDSLESDAPPLPTLSEEARELLIAAAESDRGYVQVHSNLGGFRVQVGERLFGDFSPRSDARWQAVIQELYIEGLTTSTIGLVHLTDAGYRVADLLRGEENSPPPPSPVR